MFFIPETKELIRALLNEINERVVNTGATGTDHFYALALCEAYYKFDD